jgi:hypothetical protein
VHAIVTGGGLSARTRAAWESGGAIQGSLRDNLETLYGAVDEGAVTIALPAFVKKELEGYLDCGVLCRGFARLKCESCGERRLVAFSCKGTLHAATRAGPSRRSGAKPSASTCSDPP